MFSQNIENILKPSIIALESFSISDGVYSRDSLINLYWQYHQRFKTFKVYSYPNSHILDLGSGSGGLHFWKEFLTPFRTDIKMAGIDLYKGEFIDNYEQFHMTNLDENDLPFTTAFFDFINISHVIEHVKDWKSMLRKCDKVLKSNGIIYIETPSKHTVSLPKKDYYVDRGFPCQITNFFDDTTHIEAVDLDLVGEYANSYGYTILEKGFCKIPFLEDFLISFGYIHKDQEISQYGIWSKLLFSSYLIIQKS